ncbi:MAG: 2-amino-4-hydroxy-6-hydroxymethyldihydropteridine diphosphokinase [Oscillospiraceae bacterium]
MYKINIDSLEVWANHGVANEEKVLGQKFLISAELILNNTSINHGDNVSSTVNYAEVCNVIKEVATKEQFNLIETLAENIAERILLDFYKIKSLKIKVSKPNAPIPIHFKNISVEVERSWHTAYISMGSNMGNRTQYLNDAIKDIAQNPLCRVMAISEFINTKPVGNVPQDDFLNACICIETLYSPYELLEMLHSVENKAGRKRTIKWGPRTLDLDIILFDDTIISDGTLTIPHAEMHNRFFVLIPLVEIAPYVVHPVYKCTSSELLTRLKQKEDLKS